MPSPHGQLPTLSGFPFAGMSRRGQESAPFELLIAIIVMTFVIVIGFNALDLLNQRTCEGTLNQNMEEIKTAIELVAKNKSKANIDFGLPNCYSDKEAKLRIIERQESAYCSAHCGGSLEQCTVLQFSSYTPSYTQTKCLGISLGTSFPTGLPCDARALDPPDRYEIADLKNENVGVQPGTYTLIKQSDLLSGSPQICAYRRK